LRTIAMVRISKGAEAFGHGAVLLPTDKPCVVCGERITLTAKKCVKCAYFQDWRRFTDLIPAPLPWIAALVSAAIAGLPLLKSLIHVPESQIEFASPTIQSVEDRSLKLIVANVGDRPARLGSLKIECAPVSPSNRPCVFELSLAGTIDKSIILPETTNVVAFSTESAIGEATKDFTSSLLVGYDGPPISNGCRITLALFNFRSGKQDIQSNMSCAVIAQIVHMGALRNYMQ
jgi:hypothetical protein